MIVLHASWCDGVLELWTERRVTGEELPPPRPGRLPAHPGPLAFDGGNEGTTAALRVAAGPEDLRVGSPRRREVWLPTRGKRALPSTPALAPPVEGGATLRLVPWEMSALPLHPLGLGALARFAGREDLPVEGILAGADLPWWARLYGLGLELAAEQSFLPALEDAPSGMVPVWRLWLEERHRQRIAELARAMPGSVRALRPCGEKKAPSAPPEQVVREALEDLVDDCIRRAFPRETGAPEEAESIDEAWLAALGPAGEGSHFRDSRGLREFAGRLARWKRPLDLVAASAHRLCFRLEEPDDEEGPWTVRLFVQSRRDPSLQLPLADVWRGGESAAGQVSREYLLTALGQAGALCGAVKAMADAEPWGWETDVEGAHRFLGNEAPALEASGFGVFLPSWWAPATRRKRLSLRGRAKGTTSESAGGLGMDTLLQVDWALALDGSELSLEELERLSRIKAPLVRLRGEWTELPAGEIQPALDFVRRHSGREVTAREVLRQSLGGEAEGELPVSELQPEGWIEELLQRLRGGAPPEAPAEPQGLQATLRPYQTRGYAWLDALSRWNLGACLADDMGLGKTLQALSVVARRKEQGETRPVLLVCPTSVLTNWERETQRFCPGLATCLHHGPGRSRDDAFLQGLRDVDMVLTGYALLNRDSALLQQVEWSGVILDEAQNIKNPETAQSRAARSMSADYRIALTGTPVENHVGDLWSIMDFLNPGFLGGRSAFRKHFLVPIQRKGDQEALQRLRGLTSPFILRRVKSDPEIAPDLPERQEMKVWCGLSAEQGTLYRAVLRELEEALGDAEGIQRKGMVLSSLARLKQICNHPAHFLGDGSAPARDRSGKLARLTEMVAELLDSGDRALLFTQFREMGELLQHHLTETFGREVLFLHGGVPRKRRDEMIRRFQEEASGPPLFILSLKAGGTGLNLTRAAHVFHYDRWWNPSVEDQATDRAHRIGQTRDVQVHKFVCAGTLEERIDRMLEEKKSVAGAVVGTGEQWITELSDDEVRELVSLDREAVVS